MVSAKRRDRAARVKAGLAAGIKGQTEDGDSPMKVPPVPLWYWK